MSLLRIHNGNGHVERGLNSVDFFIVAIFVKYLVGFMNKVLIIPSSLYEQSGDRTGLILKILERHMAVKTTPLN